MPARGGADDFVGIGGPDEGLGLLIVVHDEAVDGGLQIDDALGVDWSSVLDAYEGLRHPADDNP